MKINEGDILIINAFNLLEMYVKINICHSESSLCIFQFGVYLVTTNRYKQKTNK